MSAVSGEKQNAVVAPGVKPPLAVPRRLLKMRSDATLAERFAAGDELAFDVLYERHRPVVLAVSMGVLGTTQDAEDATQETFSALAVALRTKPPAEMRPWLIRVARNASIDTTRRRRHRLLTLDGEIPDIPARPTGAGQAELAMVLDGIRDLPEGQRMALLMRELGGHTYAEIAEFLETDEEAVKGLIARARVGLRTYREATELPCATARSTIAAEPDGRRYDKTIRRHLRTCGSCRSYRAALRSDAKTLRAAMPLPAGGVATGGLSSGAFAAAKGAVLGYGLTQAAATCAASVCAVGAVGGMVFIAPVHKLGIMPIVPPDKAMDHHNAKLSGRVAKQHVVAPVATQATVVPARHTTVLSRAAIHSRKAKIHLPALAHHQRQASVTVVKLPAGLGTHTLKATPPTHVHLPTQTQLQGSTPTTVQAVTPPSPTQVQATLPAAQTPVQTTPQAPPAQTPTQTVPQPPAQTTTTPTHGYTPGQTGWTTTTPTTGSTTTTTPGSTQTGTTPTGTTTTPTQTGTTPTGTGTTPTGTGTTPTGTETTPTGTETQPTTGSTVPALGTYGHGHGHGHGSSWHPSTGGTTTSTTTTPSTTTPSSLTPTSTATTAYTQPATITTPNQGWGNSYDNSSDQQSSWTGSYGHQG
jgi:RNA polymerase sigma factor (sigma-70 family)